MTKRNNTNKEAFIYYGNSMSSVLTMRAIIQQIMKTCGSIPDISFYNIYYMHTLSVVWLTGITGWTGFDSAAKNKKRCQLFTNGVWILLFSVWSPNNSLNNFLDSSASVTSFL